MEIKQLEKNMFVGPQITMADLQILAQSGFTDVVCNRPDSEHSAESGSAALAAKAKGLGLTFHYEPMVPGQPAEGAAKSLSRLLEKPQIKVFAYCRSGARSTKAWAAARPASTQNSVPA